MLRMEREEITWTLIKCETNRLKSFRYGRATGQYVLDPSFWSFVLRLCVIYYIISGFSGKEIAWVFKRESLIQETGYAGEGRAEESSCRRGHNTPKRITPGPEWGGKGWGSSEGSWKWLSYCRRRCQGQIGSSRNNLASPSSLPLSPAGSSLAIPSLGTSLQGSPFLQCRAEQRRNEEWIPGRMGLGPAQTLCTLAEARYSFLMFRWELPLGGTCITPLKLSCCTLPLLRASRVTPDCSLCLDSVALLHYLK